VSTILYIQYTNPSGYPPLEHSSLLLADLGWRVCHLGTAAQGGAREIKLPKHPSINMTLMPAPAGGWRTAVHYAHFLAWCRSQVIRLRPDVVYCSDVRSYPVGLWASRRKGLTTVLHEHDPPPRTDGGRVLQILRGVRIAFARRASLIVIPQDERAKTFLTDTGTDPVRLRVVYNCPLRRELEALSVRPYEARQGLTLWYHGTLGSAQIPLAVVEALARLPADVRIELAGYETVGSVGYIAELQARATTLGVADRLHIHGALPLRADLLNTASRADIGLALFATNFRDPMVGASNKPFDYLTCGLPLLTNRTPEWEGFFGSEGVSVSCDPNDAGDIARAVLIMREDPARRKRMAAIGRRLLETRWNYETQFAPVLEVLEGRQRAAL
jgi:glycosyltransferase involved in cell wall biosynthesis